jgi:hypothetical protein
MKQIAGGTRVGNLYSLSEVPTSDVEDISLMSNENENKKTEKAILWHRRLGHVCSSKLLEMK